MRKKFVAGNWKMNMLGKEAGELARGVAGGVSHVTGEVDVVLAPPFTALHAVAEAIEGTGLQLGAQDVFWEEKGPYTGEVSPAMLVDAGCEWVIIGHSERRNIFHETDEMVRKKIDAALAEGLKVIVCVGETLAEKEGGQTVGVVDGQVESALSGLEIRDPSRLVVAYEPIWAIGTGHNATPEEAEFVHATIREIAGKILGGIADRVRIVYGGSVTEDNIGELLAERDIDGALVGGASLRADAMTSIVLKAGE